MQAIGRSAPFALLLCAAIYLLSLTRHFDFPHVPGRLGPDVWPQALLVLMILTCLAGIVTSILASWRSGPATERRQEPAAATGEALQDAPEVPSMYRLVAAGLALFLIYPVALEYLGFLVATFLLMALFMLVGRWRNLPGVALASAAGTLLLFYVFRGLVYVSFPLGVEPFQSFTLWVARLMGMH
jgi:hypothetical protein